MSNANQRAEMPLDLLHRGAPYISSDTDRAFEYKRQAPEMPELVEHIALLRHALEDAADALDMFGRQAGGSMNRGDMPHPTSLSYHTGKIHRLLDEVARHRTFFFGAQASALGTARDFFRADS